MSSESSEPEIPIPDPTIAGYAASDGPTTDDTLGFKPYVEAIASFLTAHETKPPITISIEGEWGSGKSSFLLQLEKAILEISPKDAAKPLTVRFNAWRHDQQDQLWAAFALAFIESLRKEIGWRRALQGDWNLFWKRLDWKKFSESEQARAGVALLFLIGAAILSRLPIRDLFSLLKWLSQAKPGDASPTSLLLHLAVDGPWAIIVCSAIVGAWKSWKAFRLPISLDLKKYLADPGYDGHTAFIETFHKDLQSLVACYAGESRVFIFVDDLDRCDVPRAAQLMQAINLMIGENEQLVFILGMDREKVAAGVALKYKDLFPFLRETAKWKAGETPDDYSPIAFGYAYLEKFIQLSFTLPIPNTEAVLNRFLAPKRTAELATPTNKSRHPERSEAPTTGPKLPAPDNAETPSPDSPGAVEYHRVKIQEDDERTRDIIRMTAPLFEYNPRRLKQFSNTFRLGLYIASDLGLFDKNGRLGDAQQSGSPTPEQVGKFIAFLLRFPDLRFSIEKRTDLLELLEQNAIHVRRQRLKEPETSPDARFSRWLDQPGAIDVLTYHLGFDGFIGDQLQYSLRRFDITPFTTLLPRASRPPQNAAEPKPNESKSTVDSATAGTDLAGPASVELLALARKYEQVRSSMPASNDRTLQMTDIFDQAVGIAANQHPDQVRLLWTELLQQPYSSDGMRLMTVALAFALPSPTNTSWLVNMLDDYHSWFEHYWCMRALLKHVDYLDQLWRKKIESILDRHWGDIAKDPGRLDEAIELRDLVSLEEGFAPEAGDDLDSFNLLEIPPPE